MLLLELIICLILTVINCAIFGISVVQQMDMILVSDFVDTNKILIAISLLSIVIAFIFVLI